MDRDETHQEDYVVGKLGEELVEKLSWKAALEQKLCTIYSVTLEELTMPVALASFLMMVSFGQLCGILYNVHGDTVCKDALESSFRAFLDALRLFPHVVAQDNELLFFSCAYLCFFVQLLYTASLWGVWEYDKSGKKRYIQLAKIATHLTPLIYWVLLVPTGEFFAGILKCDFGNKRHLWLSSMKCWDTPHIIHVCTFGLLFLVYLGNVLVICLFGNESNPYEERNAFRRFTWSYEFVYLVLRLAAIGYEVYSGSQYASIAYHATMTFVACAMVYYYLVYIPYYDQTVSTVFGGCLLYLAWLSLNLTMAETAVVLGVSYNGHSLIIATGILIVYSMIGALRQHCIEGLIMQNRIDEIVSEASFEVYVHNIAQLIITKDLRSLSIMEDIFLQGFVATHKSECQHPDCPLNNSETYYFPLMKERSPPKNRVITDKICLRYLVLRMYLLRLAQGKKGPSFLETHNEASSSARLHIACAYFVVYGIGNYHLAAMDFEQAAQVDKTLWVQAAIVRGRRLVERLQEDANKKKYIHFNEKLESLDVRLVLEYEARLLRLKKKLGEVADAQKGLCGELLVPVPDLNKAHSFGLRIVSACGEVADLWGDLRAMNCKDPKAEITFGYYLGELLGLHEEAEAHIRAGKTIGERQEHTHGQELIQGQECMFVEDCAVLGVSGAPGSLGRIIMASLGITRLFEYTPTDLIGRDLTLIIPNFLAKHHRGFMERYLKTGEGALLDRPTDVFASDKQQHVIRTRIYIRQYIDLRHGTIFLALLRSYPREEATILTNCEGKILALSSNAFPTISELSPNTLREQDIYIFYVCPTLCNPTSATPFASAAADAASSYANLEGELELAFRFPTNLAAGALTIHGDGQLTGTNNFKDKKVDILTLIKNQYKDVFDYASGQEARKWCKITNYKMPQEELSFKAIAFSRALFGPGEANMSNVSKDQYSTIALDIYQDQTTLLTPTISKEPSSQPPSPPTSNAGDRQPEPQFPNVPGRKKPAMKAKKLSLFAVTVLEEVKKEDNAGEKPKSKHKDKDKDEEQEKEKEMPSEKAHEKYEEKLDDKPMDKAEEKLDDKPMDKAEEKLDDKSMEKVEEKGESKGDAQTSRLEQSSVTNDPETTRNILLREPEGKERTREVSPTHSRNKNERQEGGVPARIRGALMKHLKVIRGTSFAQYYPRLVRYANWAVSALFVIALALCMTVYIYHVVTLTAISNTCNTAKKTRAQYNVEILESVRSLSMLMPAADGMPLLNLTIRPAYNYATIGYSPSENMTYQQWKIRNLRLYAGAMAAIKNEAVIASLKFNEKVNREAVLSSAVPIVYNRYPKQIPSDVRTSYTVLIPCVFLSFPDRLFILC